MLPLLKSLTATALILSGVCASAADGSNADEIIRQVREPKRR